LNAAPVTPACRSRRTSTLGVNAMELGRIAVHFAVSVPRRYTIIVAPGETQNDLLLSAIVIVSARLAQAAVAPRVAVAVAAGAVAAAAGLAFCAQPAASAPSPKAAATAVRHALRPFISPSSPSLSFLSGRAGCQLTTAST